MGTLRRLSENRTTWGLFAAGALSEIVYILFFLFPFYLPQFYDIPHLDLGKITRYEPDAAWRFFGAFTALFLIYYAAYRLCLAGRLHNRGKGRLPTLAFGYEEDRARDGDQISPGSAERANLALVVVFSLLFSVTLLLVYPIGAADVFDYIVHGRILVHYQQNPFVTLIADFPNDPLYPYPAWAHVPSVYGPIWMIISALPSMLAGDNLLLNLLLYKGLVTVFFLLSVLLVYRILQLIAPHYTLPGTVLFAWNPLAIYETAGNGHNDAAMVFLFLAGIYFFAARRHSLSILTLVASGLLKFLAGALAPLFMIAIARSIPDLRGRAAFVAKSIVTSVMLTWALYFSFWTGPDVLGIARREGMFTSSLPTLAMLGLSPSLGEQEAQQLIVRISAFLFALVFIWHAVRLRQQTTNPLESGFELLYTYLLFFCLWFQPWYLIWVIPLAALIPRLDIANRTMVFSFTAALSYFVFVFLWVWHADSFDTLAVQGRAVALIYPLPLLLTAHGLFGNRTNARLKNASLKK